MARLRLILALALLLPTARGGDATAAPATDAKIAPWVLAHTAAGEEAEFLVLMAQQASLDAAFRLPTREEKGRYVYDALRAAARASQGPMLQWLAEQGVPHRPFYIVNAVWVRGDLALARALAARPDVARLEANPEVRRPLAEPGDPPDEPAAAALAEPGGGVEPNIEYVHAPDVWALGFTGQGIVIGGQDTGYDWAHPALKPHYRGWNGTTADHDYNWHDAIHNETGSDCLADSPEPCDGHGHGTHTMGIAVGDDGLGQQIGMAPGAQWIGCRNMDNNGHGTPATYLECFEFLLAPYPVGGDPQTEGDPALAPDVTVNSWSCTVSEGCTDPNLLLAAVRGHQAAGILTVTSAGNHGAACSTVHEPPAIYKGAYSVGALNYMTDTIAPFSSRGPVIVDGSGRPKPDIAAPGTSVESSVPVSKDSDGYGTMSGTSMAAPHVAGAAALLWSARPALRGHLEATMAVLNEAAHDLPDDTCGPDGVPNFTYGYGRLDVLAAVNALPAGAGTLTGVVTSTLTGLGVPGADVQASLSLTPSIAFDAAADPQGVYTLTVPPGTYTVTAMALGYLPASVGGVAVESDTAAVQNFSLAGAHNALLPFVGQSIPQPDAAPPHEASLLPTVEWNSRANTSRRA